MVVNDYSRIVSDLFEYISQAKTNLSIEMNNALGFNFNIKAGAIQIYKGRAIGNQVELKKIILSPTFTEGIEAQKDLDAIIKKNAINVVPVD